MATGPTLSALLGATVGLRRRRYIYTSGSKQVDHMATGEVSNYVSAN
jgi:hypothetical protein